MAALELYLYIEVRRLEIGKVNAISIRRIREGKRSHLVNATFEWLLTVVIDGREWQKRLKVLLSL